MLPNEDIQPRTTFCWDPCNSLRMKAFMERSVSMKRTVEMALAVLLFALHGLACGPNTAEEASPETVKQKLAVADYAASNTDYTSVGYAAFPITVSPNEAVMLGTCDINEGVYAGDTYLRLYNGTTQVASDDEDCISGVGGSRMKFLNSGPSSLNLEIRAGCWASGACSGTVAVSRRKGIFAFNVSNTNNATVNFFSRRVYYNAGDVALISTCAYNAYTASVTSGDTYLRLDREVSAGAFSEVASNDNSPSGASRCGSASTIRYDVQSSGYYRIRAGCAVNGSCAGSFAAYVE